MFVKQDLHARNCLGPNTDQDWIRIQMVLCMNKFKRFRFHKIWAFSLEGWRLCLELGRLSWRFTKKFTIFLLLIFNFFKLFGQRKPGVGSESASGSVFSKKNLVSSPDSLNLNPKHCYRSIRLHWKTILFFRSELPTRKQKNSKVS
jgi:hypothetical protein